MPREVVLRHRLPHFDHLFGNDWYSAGYYSYLWSDVMAADAWQAFVEAGGPWDADANDRLRTHILSDGNSIDRAEAYRRFRGRDPDIQALLDARGFATVEPVETAPPLIIDAHVADVRDALARRRAVVLSASPGAGKTTRIPPALIDAGPVILLQPRRVAARAVARRIAEEREWTLGREVGWQIRFEKRFTRDTRLLVVTEGILTARLQQDPLLSDFATIVLDEFHERSIHADLGLALARQAWLARDDLRIVVMSATLDVQSVARFLGDAPVVNVPGALHPLTIEYGEGESIVEAVRQCAAENERDRCCVFCQARARSSGRGADLVASRAAGVDIVPLHGSLDGDAQDAAIRAVDRRRIILATNIAETSLTVPGVSAVIDTGQVKVARYDADRGVDSLTLERITLDSADQRAGRAARLGPASSDGCGTRATGCARTANRRSRESISPRLSSTCWHGVQIRCRSTGSKRRLPIAFTRRCACCTGSVRSTATAAARVSRRSAVSCSAFLFILALRGS